MPAPIAGRFLAAYGAQVLRIDPPDWEEPGVVPEVTLGKRCAGLDLTQQGDRETFERLLGEADIVLHGYRAGALDGLGYDEEARRRINPNLIDVSLNAYGWTGPWKDRRGFDSLVQMSSGIAHQGMIWSGKDKPTPLPVQALDHATGYLMAAAAITGLTGRLLVGSTMTAKLSLARTAHLLVSHRDTGDITAMPPETPRRPCARDRANRMGPRTASSFSSIDYRQPGTLGPAFRTLALLTAGVALRRSRISRSR